MATITQEDLPRLQFVGCWWCIDQRVEKRLWLKDAAKVVGKRFACPNHVKEAVLEEVRS